MSIKTKIPVLIIIMLIFNTLALYLYYQLYFYQMIADKIKKISGVTIEKEILRENRMIKELLNYELLIITLLVLILGVVLYFIYSRPLYQLNKSVKAYKTKLIPPTRRQDEIGQLQNSFAILSGELQEEKLIQNRIIASISHDIKTPLTSVLGYSESLMKKELPKERVRQYLEIIHSKAQDIEEIVQDFDSYIEGKLATDLKKQPCRLSFIVEMLRMEYLKELESQNVNMEIKNLCQPADEVNIDLAKIRRVFANLIGNSIKHNANKNGLKITILIESNKGKTTFCVSDNGYGVSDKDRAHIFEPFYTSDKSRAVSGLGLSICKNIIEAHSGEIWVDSATETGLTIWFRL